MCPKNGSSLDLDPDPMDLMDLRLTGFGSRSNPSISYTGPASHSHRYTIGFRYQFFKSFGVYEIWYGPKHKVRLGKGTETELHGSKFMHRASPVQSE